MSRSAFTPDDISSAQLRLLEFVLQQVTGQAERLRRQFEGDEVNAGDAAAVVNKIARTLHIVTDPNGKAPVQPSSMSGPLGNPGGG